MGAKILTLHAGTPRFLRRFFLCVTAVLIAAAVCFVGCGKGGGSIAGKEPIKRVIKVESNVDALRAWAANGAGQVFGGHI